MIRLFVAIELPEDVRQRIAAMRGGVPGARWLHPENMHVTVRFIGGVDEGTCHDIDAALSQIRAPAFDIMLEGVGFFGAARTARVLFVPVAPSRPLAFLHDKIESALVRMGLEPEDRKFQPHVTLARLRSAPPRRLLDFVSANNLFRAGPIAISNFTLFSSARGEGRSVYTPEAVYPLTPA
jgi:2'-5' RNA ligase